MIGTMVWDRIHQRDVRSEPVEEWGGLGYTLEALSASIPDGWEIVPIVKVGSDLSESALRWLHRVERLEAGTGVMVVPEPNNRVEIRYVSAGRRTERLTGGVPPWSWEELAPRLVDLDALYVNFISGFELDLTTAERVRATFPGPTYADLHSLFLGLGATGFRVPRELGGWERWLRCFDAVQVNDEEFELLGRVTGDPWRLAAGAVGPDLKVILVTMGPDGAGYVASGAFDPSPATWPALRSTVGQAGPARSGRVPQASPRAGGDPTGCGDVWGATLFAGLLSGVTLDAAMAQANRRAARNVEYRGAEGLRFHLQGRFGRPEAMAR